MHIVVNPYTAEEIARYPLFENGKVENALAVADTAQRTWRQTSFAERRALLESLAKALENEAPKLAQLMTQEMGKRYRDGLAEIKKCASCCRYFAANGERFLADQMLDSPLGKAHVHFQPLGILLAVMPWNFPFWQVIRALAPNLMAGNVLLLKHASNTPGCALAIESVMQEAGAPPGLLQTLLIDKETVARLINDARICAVTLTGSTEAGRSIAQAAGKALKKNVLELGGSDAYLILEDADLEHAVAQCVKSRLLNGGQSCIAAKRFLLLPGIAGEFTERMQALMQNVRIGDPMEDATELQPLARHDLRDGLHAQVQGSHAKGAKILCGGGIPDHEGAFYPATVLTNVTRGMPAYDDELFGPVASLIHAHDEEDAVRIANATTFGLGAALFTRDLDRAQHLAKHLVAGTVSINGYVQSDPALPFGGVKESGYGRELGMMGIREFVNAQTIVESAR